MKRSTLPLLVAATATLAAAATIAPASPKPGGLVYTDIRQGGTEIVLRDSAGVHRDLTANAANDEFPALSPDGRSVAFSSDRDGDYDIYKMKIDGTGVTRVTNVDGNESYPAWSPDGRTIAFTQTRDAQEAEIYLVKADGTNRKRLTRTKPHVIDTQPAFSPDGRHLVFSSSRVAYTNSEIYRLRLSDGRLTRLTFHGSGKDGAPGADVLPEYSPDGKRIAFVSDRGGSHQIWTMDPSGKRVRRVTNIAGHDVTFPRYSGDGRRLAYMTSSLQGGRSSVFTARADGTKAERVATGEAPNW